MDRLGNREKIVVGKHIHFQVIMKWKEWVLQQNRVILMASNDQNFCLILDMMILKYGEIENMKFNICGCAI